MDLKKAVYERRSARKFKDALIDEKSINKIIEYGMQAPTACNVQGWKFIIVNDRTIKKWLVDSGAPLFIGSAPAGVLVLYDNRTGNDEYKDNIQSAGATIQNMLLAAHSLGMGACWVCRLPSQDTMKKMFGIPSGFDVVAYIALGYPEIMPKKMPRKYSLDDVVSVNTFKSRITKESIKRRVYLLTPKPLKLFYRLCFEGRFAKKLKRKRE